MRENGSLRHTLDRKRDPAGGVSGSRHEDVFSRRQSADAWRERHPAVAG